jgi:hypothetical protein
MKPKIYSYYESIPTRRQEEEFGRSHVWKASWERNGWEPIMLNNSHAKGSPLFQKLVAKILRVAPELSAADQNNFQKIIIRFVKWCALHAAGGGWMSEYDVVNSGFTKSDAENFEKKSLVLMGDKKSFLMFVNEEMCRSCISTFISDSINIGDKIKSEFDILNCENSLAEAHGKVIHPEFELGKSKAELMKSLIE